MGKSRVIPPREQTWAEEVANSVSHGIALAAALVGTPFLVLQAISYQSPGFIVGVSIFATTTVLLYLASTLYHALPPGKAKRVFNVLDHSAIYLLIIAIEPLSARLPVQGLLWLVAGGVAYTAGVAFYATGARLRYGHFIWHLFVRAGTVCHYVAVFWYAA